jgi:GNAT superfamily N-acetyltransferase
MSEPLIRLTRPDDISKLQTIDLKCYQYPLSMKAWQEYVNGSGKAGKARIVICQVYQTAAGYAMWQVDQEHTSTEVLRLGVLPKFRRNKLGTLLMEACVRDSQKNRCDKVRILVPHIHCRPGDPDDVSAFLGVCGFKASGKCISDWRQMYGEWVDAYEFERKLDVFASGV